MALTKDGGACILNLPVCRRGVLSTGPQVISYGVRPQGQSEPQSDAEKACAVSTGEAIVGFLKPD